MDDKGNVTFAVTYLEADLSQRNELLVSNTSHLFRTFYASKGIACVPVISEPKSIDKDLVYKAGVYERDVSLNFNTRVEFWEHLNEIGELWCKNGNSLSHMWLTFKNGSELCKRAKQFHTDVAVVEIGFGTLPKMNCFMQHYSYKTSSSIKEMSGSFLHNQRYFVIYVSLQHERNCGKAQKFVVNYKSIVKIIVNYIPDKNIIDIYFVLRHTPFLYEEKENGSETGMNFHSNYSERRWERSLQFGCNCNKSACKLNTLGRSTTFKVVMLKSRSQGVLNRLIQRCAEGTKFHFCNVHVEAASEIKDFETFPHIEFKKFEKNVDSYADYKFSSQFAWNVLLSKSLEVKDQVLMSGSLWQLMSKQIQKHSVNNLEALVNALYHIGEIIAQNEIFIFWDALHHLYEHYKYRKGKLEMPNGMCLVRRVILTPSKLIYLPPAEHFENRITRKFGAEYMLRVSVQDDDFSKLTFATHNHSSRDKFLDTVIGKWLQNGIYVEPRRYEMLAASNSQMREHGLWMYAPDRQGNDAASIRKWMGDFTHIRSVAKCMARMGQCFSTSEEAVQVEVSEDNVLRMEDVKTEDEVFTFSDGIGMISHDLAEQVRNTLNARLSINDNAPIYSPSAFQIRYKGCKGMVVESMTLQGQLLAIRPSMEKFRCNTSNVLEVVKISAPRILFLNRPLITILEQLGVKQNVFLKLQKDMVMDFTDAFIYEEKALKLLAGHMPHSFPYSSLLKTGVCLSSEPYFRSLLLSLYKNVIDLLRTKARIAIPPEYGRNMLGVLDESRTLEYGQVFVQYSKEIGNSPSPLHILKGIVVVTKNPCMHPGDVRKFQAVDVPALRHIKDCIVFPAKGPRPHPDEMAGSDLDGDEYVVIWKSDLIFPQDNKTPMMYPVSQEIKHTGSIQVEDMIKFFCSFIQNDNVGVLANAHLAWADSHLEGIFSPECLSIAKKYPAALDFAKTGTTCYLERDEKPISYPDFMEKGTVKNSYKSRKVLGLMYRVTRILEASISKIDMLNHAVHIEPDPLMEYPGWERYRESAKAHRAEYTKRIKDILCKYNMESEAEAITGYIGKITEYSQTRYDKTNTITIVKSYIIDTMKKYHHEFFEAHKEDCNSMRLTSSERLQCKYQRASAWYMVTYTSDDVSVLSFPWVISDVLMELRKTRLKDSEEELTGTKSSFIESIDKDLHEKFSIFLNSTDGRCFCVEVLHNIVSGWMSMSAINLTRSEDASCFRCYMRIVEHFQRTTERLCCSHTVIGCQCNSRCSPMILLLSFLRFYASEIHCDVGECDPVLGLQVQCPGFKAANLQSVALQTYSSLAITKNVEHLGLMDHTFGPFPVDEDGYQEGDPIRIPIPKEYNEIIRDYLEELQQLLKEMSGTRDVIIIHDMDRRLGSWYILMQSVGKPWQRWNAEELMLDDSSFQYVMDKMRIKIQAQ